MSETPLGWAQLFDNGRGDADNEVPFLGIAQALAADARCIVEVGCGRGGAVDVDQPKAFQDLRGPGRVVVGIDLDPAAADNPVLDEFRLIESSGRWPLEDGEADLAVSDWVLEHVADPQQFVAELTRVLRPGGVFVARTVSRRSPLSVAARLIPNHRHSRVLSKLQPTREERDVFPTQYRMNSRPDLDALLADYEWNIVHCSGLHHYLKPWPRFSRAVAATEPRIPRSWRMTIILYARKRSI